MIATLSRLRAGPGRYDELLAVLRGVEDDIAKETGVVTFGFYPSTVDPDVVWLHDVFENESARDAHVSAPWHARMVEAIRPLLVGPPERHPIDVASVFVAGRWRGP